MAKQVYPYVILVVLAAAAGYLGGRLAQFTPGSSSQPSIPATVKAKRFEVVDDGGKIVAELTQRELNLFDGRGRVRASLRLDYNDNGVVAFSDAKCEGRAIFGFLGTDTPSQTDDDWGFVIHSPNCHMPIISLATLDEGWRGSLGVASRKSSATFSPPKK